MKSAPAQSQRGFTLLELAIVLLIIGVITGMGVTSSISVLASSRQVGTQNKIAVIEQALLQFRTANGRLPCPGDLTLAPGSANYGVEAATPGTCTGGTPTANFSAAGGTNTFATGAEGSLPAVTLGLPPDLMVDGWGNKIRYAVDISMTANGAFVTTPAGCVDGAITINDASGNARSSNSIYALISSGANGHGAYTKNGAITNAGSTNASEQTNCHCNASATATAYAPTYVQRDPYVNSGSATDTFDDLVTFKERWQMQIPWETMGKCTRIYVSNGVSGAVAQYDINGAFLNTIGCSHAATPPLGTWIGPNGVAIDQNGNLWVSDQSGQRATEFNFASSGDGNPNCPGTYGNYVTRYPLTSGDMGGVAVDGFGNLWVAGNTGRIVMLNAAHTAAVGQVGCDGAGGCGGGSADGQIANAGGHNIFFAFDKNNNLWVADSVNNRVQEFSVNYGLVNSGLNMGTWVQTIGGGPSSGGNSCAGGYVNATTCSNTNGNTTCCAPNAASCTCAQGTGMGNFEYLLGIAIDPDGTSVWVVEGQDVTNRLQKFAISGSTSTLVQVIGGAGTYTSCTVSAGTHTPCVSTSSCFCGQSAANGQFHTPHAMTFDPQGNMWVADQVNSRLVEINPKIAGINASGSYILTGTTTCTDPSGNKCTGFIRNLSTSGQPFNGIAISR